MSTGFDKREDRPSVVSGVAAVREAVGQARREGRTIGFVPTMGALHAGHASLVEAAKRDGHWVVASIYVNPTQFGPKEDFGKYPRTMEADLETCRNVGVDLVFAPKDEEVYPPGDQTRVVPGGLAETLCGLSRPGHFVGVCTVVAKLFNIVQPDAAYFGQKDAQQAVIIQRMVQDLHMPVRIVVCPLVREADGLAMSSRNARLTPQQRSQALCLYRALCTGRDRLLAGEQSSGRTIAAIRAIIMETDPGIGIDYISIVEPLTLIPVAPPRGCVMLAGAIRLGDVRLIDNLLVDLQES